MSGWHDFYILAGTASATLVGLLFVGLSLHLRIVVASLEVRGLARVTLANFGAVLFVALFMVIPEGQSVLASQLIGSGVVSLIIAVPSLIAAGRVRGWAGAARARLVLRFVAAGRRGRLDGDGPVPGAVPASARSDGCLASSGSHSRQRRQPGALTVHNREMDASQALAWPSFVSKAEGWM